MCNKRMYACNTVSVSNLGGYGYSEFSALGSLQDTMDGQEIHGSGVEKAQVVKLAMAVDPCSDTY